MSIEKRKNSCLCFFETEQQLNSLVRYQEREKVDVHYIAVTPEADYAAEKTGLRYRTIEEFYSEAELVKRGIENFGRLRAFCEHFDDLVNRKMTRRNGYGKFASIMGFYYLKRIADSLLNRTVMVKSTLSALNPGSILCFEMPPWDPIDGLDWPKLGLTSRLLPAVAKCLGIKTMFVSEGMWVDVQALSRGCEQESKTILKELRDRVSWRVRRAVSYWGRYRRSELRNSTNEAWLIAERGWDVDAILNRWKNSQKGRILMLDEIIRGIVPDAATQSEVGALWEELKNDREIWRFFVIDGVDTYDLVAPTIRFYILRNLPLSFAIREKATDRFSKLRPAVLLMSGVSMPLVKAAGDAGIPSLNMQHGGLYGYAEFPITEYLDFLGPDVFMTYGSGVTRFLEEPSRAAGILPGDPRAKPVSVGSPVLDNLLKMHRNPKAKARGDRERTLMYVITNLGGDFRYHSYHMYPDIWYWRLQREVVCECARRRDANLIVKLYPANKDIILNPLVDWLRDNPIYNCKVTDSPFVEVMGFADAFAIDTPTTTLLQAITTEKPVIALADTTFLRFDRRALKLLRRRAIVSETAAEFLKSIADFLAHEDWTLPSPVNDDFLIEYGTFLNDGRSDDRAVALLRKLAIDRTEIDG
jgi:hypothetical protein